jgi:hypothetical protein
MSSVHAGAITTQRWLEALTIASVRRIHTGLRSIA